MFVIIIGGMSVRVIGMINVAVIVAMILTGQSVVKTLAPPKRHDHHSRHVHGGQNGGQCRHDPEYLVAGKRPAREIVVSGECLIKYLVL